jgi:uncharacterized protein YdbL (DUF1318 family)
MRNTLKLIVVACTFLAMAEAALTLKQARNAGKICECPNGLVATVEKRCEDDTELKIVRSIVSATNSIRRTDIKKIAKKESISVAAAGKVVSDKIKKKYPGSGCSGVKCPKV